MKNKKIILISLINSLIALPFLLNYYLRAHESPSGLGIIEVGILLVYLIGPLSLISSIVAVSMSEKKSITTAVKVNILLMVITYLFTALLLVKGLDLLITFVTIVVYIMVLSVIGYALAMFISKYVINRKEQ